MLDLIQTQLNHELAMRNKVIASGSDSLHVTLLLARIDKEITSLRKKVQDERKRRTVQERRTAVIEHTNKTKTSSDVKETKRRNWLDYIRNYTTIFGVSRFTVLQNKGGTR